MASPVDLVGAWLIGLLMAMPVEPVVAMPVELLDDLPSDFVVVLEDRSRMGFRISAECRTSCGTRRW